MREVLLCFVLWCAVALSIGPIEVIAVASPFDSMTFRTCVFWWGNVGDNGYTDAHQVGLVAAIEQLQTKYPAVTFAVKRAVNVAASSDKLGVYRGIVNSNTCNIVYFAFSDLYPGEDFLLQEAKSNPSRLYAVGDLRSFHAAAFPRNVVFVEPICDKEWFLAGALSAKLYGGSLSLLMTVGFENATAYATHAIASGIRYVQLDLGVAVTKPVIVPINSWDDASTEGTLADLAFNMTNTQIITHFTDPYAVSSAAEDRGKQSIGWNHDFSSYFYGSILTSVVRVYDAQFFWIIENWMFNVSNVSWMTFGCSISSMSQDVSSATAAYVTNLSNTLNITSLLWDADMYFTASGIPTLRGPLNRLQVGTLAFCSNYSVLNTPFLGATSCPSNFAASFTYSTESGFQVQCTACPIGTYSRNGDACAPCQGVFSGYCSQSETSSTKTSVIIGLVVGIGGGALVILLVVLIYFRRKTKVLKRRIAEKSKEPFTASAAAPDEYDVALIREEVAAKNYYLGTGTITSHGYTKYKCYLNQGTTLMLYEYPHRTADEARRLHCIYCDETNGLMAAQQRILKAQCTAALSTNSSSDRTASRTGSSIPTSTLKRSSPLLQAPPLVRVFVVNYNEENTSIEMFCEQTNGGTLEDMLEEMKGNLSEKRARMIAQPIAIGLGILHQSHLVHRTIAPHHIFITSSGSSKLYCGVLVANVGERDPDASLSIIPGVTFIAPPEVLSGRYSVRNYFEASCAIDVWSFGVLVAQMLNGGFVPWPADMVQSPSSIISYIVQGGGPVIAKGDVSDVATDFVEKATSSSATLRWTTNQLVNHRWLNPPPTTHNGSFDSGSNESGMLVLLNGSIATPQHYHVGRILGVGSFGTVHSVVMVATGEELAMKTVVFDLHDSVNEKRLRRAKEEFEALSKVEHPNIVRYVALETDSSASGTASRTSFPNQSTTLSQSGTSSGMMRSTTRRVQVTSPNVVTLRIFMEYVSGGTLKQRMVACGGRLDELECMRTVRSILTGLAFVHEKGIVHRDIKPSNFLYCGPPNFVKLADFGSAAIVSESATSTYTMQGTLLYMAPEIIREEQPTWAADIWSVGTTVMEMMTGEPPWSEATGQNCAIMAVVAYISSEEPLRLPLSRVSPLCGSFLSACLIRSVALRSTAESLLRHPWLSDAYETELSVNSSLKQ